MPILYRYPIAKKENKNEIEIWIKKDGFKTGTRLKFRLRNGKNIL